MKDIYDRSKWPTPEANPLVQLLLLGDDWYTNKEINLALDPERPEKPRGAPMADLKQTMKVIGEDHSAIRTARGTWRITAAPAHAHGGTERVYSREALILIGMRANTVNAAAFRAWLSSRVSEEFANG